LIQPFEALCDEQHQSLLKEMPCNMNGTNQCSRSEDFDQTRHASAVNQTPISGRWSEVTMFVLLFMAIQPACSWHDELDPLLAKRK